MKEFYQGRLNKHQNKLLRYLKYVLNDHIVLVGSFIFGGAALYYADFVKTLDSSFFLGKPIVLIAWFSMLLVGRLATLIHPADRVFLLPKEKAMSSYLKAALRHSFGLPAVCILLSVGIAMPLLIAVGNATLVDFAIYLLLLLSLKASYLLQLGQTLFQANLATKRRAVTTWYVSSLIFLVIGLYFSNWLALLLSIILLTYLHKLLNQSFNQKQLDWEGMVAGEQQRMKRIYQFINLFTDVPGISGKIKRRKFLDPLLARIPQIQKQSYMYLYSRSLVRGSEYSQLILRLTLVGGVIIAFSQQFIIVLIASLVFVYLIGFQLLPMYSQYDYMVMTQLYPLASAAKRESFSRLIRVVLLVVATIFALIALIVLPLWQDKGVVALALLIEVVLFSQFYAPSRIRKIEKR